MFAAQQREEKRRGDLAAPPMRADRVDSRDDFDGLSRDQALDVTKREQGDALMEPVWKPIELQPGQSVQSFITDNTMRVEQPGQADSIIKTVLPMRAVDRESGFKEPVSLALDKQGDIYKPDNALVDETLPVTLMDGVRLGGTGVSMRPKTDNPDAKGEPVAGKVFYANVQTDTDWIVAPLPTGVETFTQLRSPAAPEDLQLIVDVPEGATLRLHPGDASGPSGARQSPAAEVVGADGEVIATFSTPVAFDAQQRPVPVSYEVKDDRLRMHVAHRGADVDYPLMVDPVTENQLYWHNAGSTDMAGWEYETNVANYFVSQQDNSLYGRGLYVHSYPYGTYQNGHLGQWVYHTQGTSFIYRAEFGYVNHDPSNSGLYEGIYGGGGWQSGVWTSPDGARGTSPYSGGAYLHYNYKTHCVDANCNYGVGAAGNLAAFGLYMYGPTGATAGRVYLGGAAVAINDRDNPSVTSVSHSNIPNAWVSSLTDTENVGLYDPGLGVKTAALESDRGWKGPAISNTFCTGRRNYRCDNSGSVPLTFNSDTSYFDTPRLPAGVSAIHTRVIDLVGNESNGPNATVRIDRTAPSIALSDVLYDRRNRDDDKRFAGIYTATAPLTVTADDAPSSDANGQSAGIRNLDVQVIDASNNVVVNSPAARSCTIDCSRSFTRSFNLDADAIPDGDYTVRVTATDAAGNSPPMTTFPITVDRRGSIVRADTWTGSPSADSADQDTSEVFDQATQSVRLEDADRTRTLQTVDCGGSPCLEMRETVPASGEDDGTISGVTATRGQGDDARLWRESTILSSRHLMNGQPVATGATTDVVPTWAHLPPGAGRSFARYDEAVDEVVDDQEVRSMRQLWVDSVTGLPLRERTSPADGDEEDIYFDYRPSRDERSSYSADYFSLTGSGPPETLAPQQSPVAAETEPSESVALAQIVREDLGLDADRQHVDDVLADQTLNSRAESLDLVGTVLTPSELASVKRVLDAQGEASDVLPSFQASHADTYAGAWYDRAGVLHVAFTADTDQSRDALMQRLTRQIGVSATTVTYTASTLSEIYDRARADLQAGALDTDKVTSVAVNDESNRVEFETSDATGSAADLASRYGPSAVALQHDGNISELYSNPRSVVISHTVGGVQIISNQNEGVAQCTSGFAALRRVGRKVARYMLTAGHCSQKNRRDRWYHYNLRDLRADDYVFGRVVKNTRYLPADRRADALIIRVNRDRASRKVYLRFQGSRPRYATVKGASTFAVRNSIACFSGSRTGSAGAANHTVCGRIEAFKASGHGGIQQIRVRLNDDCRDRHGDSGAAVWIKKQSSEKGVYALGILSGGDERLFSKCAKVVYVQSIGTSLARNGVSLAAKRQ